MSSRRAAAAIAVGLAAAGCGTSKETPVNGPIAAAYKDGIYLVQPSGAGQRRLPGSAYGSSIAWSRNGQWLVFDRADARGRRFFDAYVVRNGQWLVFDRADARGRRFFDAYVVRRDGTRIRRVLENAGYPSWAPDWVMNADGSLSHRITREAGYGPPAWAPK